MISQKHRSRRAFLAFMAVLLFTILLADSLWLWNQKEFLIDTQLEDIRDDLDLLGEISMDALLRRDYATARKTLLNWSERHPDVLSIRAVTPNGFVLAQYRAEGLECAPGLSISKTFRYGGRDRVTIDISQHTLQVDRHWSKLIWQNIFFSLLAALLLTVLLWSVLQRFAFSPMARLVQEVTDLNEQLEVRVQKRTQDLEGANQALIREAEERKQAEQNLQTSAIQRERERAQSDAVLGAIGDGVTILDRDYLVLYQNPAHAAMVGLHIGEICYAGFEGRQEVCEGCPVALTFEDGKVHTVERSVERAGGSLHFEITTSPLMDEAGNVIAAIEVVRNITDRYRIQEVIRLVDEGTARISGPSFFRRLVRHLASTLEFQYAFIGEIIANSTRVRTLAAWGGDDFMEDFEYGLDGTPCKDVYDSGDACIFQSGLQKRFPADHRLVEMGAQSFLAVPLRLPEGQTFGVMGVLDTRPISDPVGPMAILRIFASRATEQLMRQKMEDERQKLEDQLIQSQKMESIGKLAGGIAHDFNNLLSTIIGYGELAMLRIDEDDPARGPLGYILEAGNRAADLTGQLLAFSRRQVLEFKPVDLRALVEGLGKMLPRMIGEDVKLEFRYGENIRRVMADRGQIEQVLMNFAVNARDAMPGGGRLTVEVRNVDLDERFTKRHENAAPGPYVMLSATDSGTGMPPEVKEKIFEPFFTTKDSGKGTGLGLSTVYGIVRQHKGCITVESEPGLGTSFRVYLPSAAGDHADEQTAPRTEDIRQGKETLLVVDDESSIRNLLADILAPLGYVVLTAQNGREALSLAEAQKGQIDLLLTDIIMPGMKGTELARNLRRLYPSVKVIYMSGYLDDSRFVLDTQDKGVVFLQKPLTPAKLTRKLREVLDSNPSVTRSLPPRT